MARDRFVGPLWKTLKTQACFCREVPTFERASSGPGCVGQCWQGGAGTLTEDREVERGRGLEIGQRRTCYVSKEDHPRWTV